jgi:hypothetical protein
LRSTVLKNHTTTAAQVRTALNIHLEDPISTKTVRHELHESSIQGRAAIPKPLINESNAQMRKQWCHMTIKPGQQITRNVRMILSDESSFTLFPTSGRVYSWRTPKEAYSPECLVPTVKEWGGPVLVWAAISWYSILLVPLLPFMAKLL